MHFHTTGLAVEAWIHLAEDAVLVNLAVKQDSLINADSFFSS